jgi:pimeloyl-ACP methyl ester carboxylesterase
MAQFTTSDGLSLHYTDEGTGLPLLCLAGLTRTGADFDYVAPHLKSVRLIRMDYRGRGQSDRDPNWQNYVLPVECRDVIELLDHLGLDAVAILGTSRGGLNAMGLAATAPDRLLGVALNDVGPELDPDGLSGIMDYLGRNPVGATFDSIAKALPHVLKGFENVPESRWQEEAHKHYVMRDGQLHITYDPKLRDAVEAGGDIPDLWPFFDALAGKPLLCLRGSGSDLLSAQTFDKMQTRNPAMMAHTVPGRGHIPFLDEPESVTALHAWLETLQ